MPDPVLWNRQQARQYVTEPGYRPAISDDELSYWRERKARAEQGAMDVLRGMGGKWAEDRLALMEKIRLDP